MPEYEQLLASLKRVLLSRLHFWTSCLAQTTVRLEGPRMVELAASELVGPAESKLVGLAAYGLVGFAA
jgi:hypothetical protein